MGGRNFKTVDMSRYIREADQRLVDTSSESSVEQPVDDDQLQKTLTMLRNQRRVFGKRKRGFSLDRLS